jgi:hypothetical protein
LVNGGAANGLKRIRAMVMAFQHLKPMRMRPAAIAIHDDCQMI